MRFDRETHTLHANGRSWQADPAGTEMSEIGGGDSFDGRTYVHRRRRCLVRFESGWAASILWGSGAYSTNHDFFYVDDPFVEEPSTVEVGVLDHTGELRMRRYDDGDGLEWHDVESYLDDRQLVALLDELAALPSDFDFGEPSPTMAEVMEMFEKYERVRGEADDG